MSGLIVFDDDLGKLAPLTDTRPAFDVRTGALTTLERIKRTAGTEVRALFVPERLRAVTEERHGARIGPGSMAATPVYVNDIPRGHADGPIVFVNGRYVVPDQRVARIPPGTAFVEAESGHLVAAHVAFAEFQKLRDAATAGGAAAARIGSDAGITISEVKSRLLMSRPWHFRAFRDAALDSDLKSLAHDAHDAPPTAVVFGSHPCSVHRQARICPNVTIDTEQGPVCIDANAVVRPGAIVCGPCYVGPNCAVLDRTIIKAHTAIGPFCKVAGEVGGCIFQGFANKAHDGHLGDSWIGEWANLGAGTTNSNLLNTYGEVVCRALPDMPNERTGETFLGAMIGDHVKMAICTRIMTGSVIHTGVMWAATAAISGCVPAFQWTTDAGQRPYRFEKFLDVARVAMARRNVKPSDEYINLLRAMCP